MSDENKTNLKETLSEDIREEIYEISSNLVDELVSEAIEGIKSEIDELLRLIFHPDADISALDASSQNQITSLKNVFNLFKNNLKDEILKDVRKELPKKITKVKLVESNKVGKRKKKPIKEEQE